MKTEDAVTCNLTTVGHGTNEDVDNPADTAVKLLVELH